MTLYRPRSRGPALQALLGQLEGTNHSTGFVARFLVLGRRVRIGDDAGARLHVRPTAFDEHGANRDTEIQVACEIQIADRARVDTTTPVLERGDDLHRTHLRRARHGSRGEAGDERIETIVLRI